MKRVNFIYGLFLFLFGIMIMSCTEDGGPIGGGGNELEVAPTITIDVEGIIGSEVLQLNVDESFIVNVSATPGAAPLDIMRITENGSLIDASRILQDGQLISANPKLILGSEKDGFLYALEINVSDVEGMSEYVIIVEDENGLFDEERISISTMELDPSLINNSVGEFQVPPGTLVELDIEAIRGSADLEFIVITDTAIIEDASRFYYGNINTPFDSNPFALPEEDKMGFSNNIYIRAHTDGGARGYRIFVFDENENAAFFDITISVGESTTNIFGVLFNAAGPEGRGGLDLDEGIGTGSQSLLAEIKDEGIDLNQPIMDNWKRQISGVNGSMVRSLIAGMGGLSESYNFESDFIRTDLIALFDAGIDFTVTNSNQEVVSPKVNVGDSFVVRNGENYYLIYIKEVNEIGDNNMDNYVIDIKF